MRTPAGIWLFQRSWIPVTQITSGAFAGTLAEPERVLLLVHGLAEHSGRYEHVASWFAARGSAVHAYDQRGHGRSQGARCHVRRFSEYLDDLEAVLAQLRRTHPQLPIYLLGHSMGGLVVAALLAEREAVVAGAVLTGAALAPGPRGSLLRLQAARLARPLPPRLRVPIGIDPVGLSRDEGVVRAYTEDPLVERKLSLSLAAELARSIGRTLAHSGRIAVPLFVLHGEDDPVCSPRGSAELQAGVMTRGTRLRTYPKLRHEIMNEPEHPGVLQDILEWLQSRRKDLTGKEAD